MKLLEIAKKNALNVHGGLNKNESIAIRAGGLTIEQLTEKCQRVAEGKEDPISENIPDDMLNHPFAVEEAQPEQLTFRPIFLKPKQVTTFFPTTPFFIGGAKLLYKTTRFISF
mgnify:CR=1 FL=1